MAVIEHSGRPVSDAPPRVNWLNDPKVRGIIWQVALVVLVGLLVYAAITNAYANLQRQRIASGFDFLQRTAGFDLSQTLISYSQASTYGRAFLVGLLNTLLVAALGITIATVLGILIGVARLSRNWVLQKLATAYVEFLRNIPLVLQLLFWYSAVLQPLPGPRQSVGLPDGILNTGVYVNSRGLFVPNPVFSDDAVGILIAFVVAVVASAALLRWASQRQKQTGQRFPAFWASAALIVGLPVLAYFVLSLVYVRPVTLDYPQLRGFNMVGGARVIPEFVALLLGLSLYTAAFIAEIVRAGIQAIHKGQTEAAYALGLRPGSALRLVVLPQALRVIVPPLTSQYLNLTKNSSLAVAIGYPDLFLAAQTINNQTGQAVEVIAMMMGIYLLVSLVTSAFMNWYNGRIALVER